MFAPRPRVRLTARAQTFTKSRTRSPCLRRLRDPVYEFRENRLTANPRNDTEVHPQRPRFPPTRRKRDDRSERLERRKKWNESNEETYVAFQGGKLLQRELRSIRKLGTSDGDARLEMSVTAGKRNRKIREQQKE